MIILVEGMQHNLQTAARFYTEQNDLMVKFSDKTATDMKKTIFLQHHKGEIIHGIPAVPAECWVVMKAGNAHESAHIIFSHRRAWERACSKGRLFQHIVNILEDARIEKAVSNMYPGTKLWLRFTNEYFFKNRKFTSSGLKGFLDGLLCYAVVGLVPEGMDDKVNEAIEECMDYTDEARNAESTWDVLKYTEKILKIAAKAFPEVESLETSKGFKGTDNPMAAPKGDEDPRRTVKRKSKSKKKGSEEEKSSSGDAKGEVGGSTGKDKDKESEDKPASAGEPSGDSKDSDKPEEKAAGSSKEEKPEEPDEPSGSEETEEDEKTSDEPGEKPEEPEEKPGEEPDEKPAGDKPEEEDEELDSSPEDTGESEEPDEPEGPGDESEDTCESDDEPEDSEPEVDGESEEFDEPEDDGEPEGSKPEEEGSFPEDDPEEEPSEADIPDTIPDDDPEMDEVLETAETELRTIEVDAERKVKATKEEEPEEVNYDKLAKEISKELIHGGVRFGLGHKKPDPVQYQQFVKKLAGPIKNLVEEIRKALEFRDSVPRRCLKKGHLDPGALWKIRVPSPEVFYRREEPGDVPVLAVDLQVDCSGSMAGGVITPDGSVKTKMDAAKEAAIVLHETCNQLKIQHSVVGFTSLNPSTIRVTHYRVVDWNEKDGAKIASLQYESENRDGYSIRIATGELEIRPEPVKLMIVLSDGMPADVNYHSDIAIADTIRAVRDAEKKGIKVIGIYFGGEEEIVVAQKIYNYLVFCKDISSLPTILGRVLKKALLG